MSDKKCKVIVIGAGVIGLTTATFLQDALPSAQITIIAEKFLTETTSNGAGGIYLPGEILRGPSEEIRMKWFRDSFRYYSNFLDTKKNLTGDLDPGIVRRRVYFLSTKDEQTVRYFQFEELFGDYRLLSQIEIQTLFGSRYKHGATHTTFVTDCRKYLPYLMKRFEERGGKIVKRRVESLEEVSDDCNLLFNCSGLGAKDLCGDINMTPIRGQVFKVQAPWVKNIIYLDDSTYIIPGTGGMVTLGGTRQFDYTSTDVDVYDSASIWERCTTVVPSLKDAQVTNQWVGLRPYRHEVRVEKEVMSLSSGKTIKVIHNYGHGGYGVMTSPGTSMHAVSLGIQALKEDSTSKL